MNQIVDKLSPGSLFVLLFLVIACTTGVVVTVSRAISEARIAKHTGKTPWKEEKPKDDKADNSASTEAE